MPIELVILGLAALLQAAQLVAMAIPVNRQLGPGYTAGSRDQPRTATGVAGRLLRAYDNHNEALILFAIAVVVVVLGGGGSGFTEACAWIYLAARIAYVPAYASGVFLLRSLIWSIGFFATIAMLIAALW